MDRNNKTRLTFVLTFALAGFGLASSDTALSAVFFATILTTAIMSLIWGADE